MILKSSSIFVSFRYDLLASILFALLSIILLYKGIIVYSQSTCWFGLNMILVAILLLLFDLLKISNFYNYLYAFIPIISSLIIIAVYSNLLYIKVIVLDVSIAIPLITFWYITTDWWWQALAYVAMVFAGIIICRNIDISKESRSGKI